MAEGLRASQGLTPLAINWRPSGAFIFSPEGAAVNSQGRQPLEEGCQPLALTEGLRHAVFLDRDGVLNQVFVRDGVTHPPSCVEEFVLLPGAADAVRRLHTVGFALVVVTNQPDVARGMQTRESVEAIHKRLRAELPMLEVLACYHDNGDNCACRKPKPGMLWEAARRWTIDLSRSFLVGDRWSDVAAGQVVGCRTLLVETPYSGAARCRPEYRVHNLAEAADWILAHSGEKKEYEAVC